MGGPASSSSCGQCHTFHKNAQDPQKCVQKGVNGRKYLVGSEQASFWSDTESSDLILVSFI